jgi:hypothetical protein
VCLYIKAVTLPLQHLDTFSSPIHRHRRRRVLLLRCRRHPPRPPPSVAPPVLCPTGFSTAVGLLKSADALAPRHAAGPPLSAPGTRATSSPTCLGLRGSLIPILLASASSPSSSSAPSSPASRAPPLPPRALSSGRPEHRRLVLLVGASHSCPPQSR